MNDLSRKVTAYPTKDEAVAEFNRLKEEWLSSMESDGDYIDCFENLADTETRYKMFDGEIEQELFDLEIRELEF